MVRAGGPVMIRSWMQQVQKLHRKFGIQTIWVTSGAIATATERVDFKKAKSGWKLAEKQALSAIGQPLLMDEYRISLQSLGMMGAQVLLSYQDLASQTGRDNFSNTIDQLLKWNVIPIINENDAVATEEIKFGDNDSLSAKVACLVGGDKLVIMTDVHGFYNDDPKKNPKARLQKILDRVPESLIEDLPKAASGMGTGGMSSKLKAAREATHAGIETVLVKGDIPDVLTLIASGDNFRGTRILGQKRRRRA